MSMTLSASMIAALVAGCSTDYSSSPSPAADPIVSAEDMALATIGTTVVRQGDYQVLRTTGNITAGVTQFRTLLGALNPTRPASSRPGARNQWDGVPAAFTNVDTFPAAFFNTNSPRGVIYATSGTGFASATTDTPTSARISPRVQRVQWDEAVRQCRLTTTDFRCRRVQHAGAVTGFGSVFADVGRSGKTTIQYFDAAGKLLASVSAPTRADSGPVVRRCGVRFPGRGTFRIVAGESPLSATAIDISRGSGKPDLVVMDDFIYGEPHAIASNTQHRVAFREAARG